MDNFKPTIKNNENPVKSNTTLISFFVVLIILIIAASVLSIISIIRSENNNISNNLTLDTLNVSQTATINKAQIKKDTFVLAKNLEGISSGYNLLTSEAGKTFIIENQDSSGISFPNIFILPEITDTDCDGLKYKFLWSVNDSSLNNLFQIHTNNPEDPIYGSVLAGVSGVSTILLNQISGSTGDFPSMFYYSGTLYPGSYLECYRDQNNWLSYGSLGTSNDNSSNNGFIGVSYVPWLMAGINVPSADSKIAFSYTTDYFYNTNTFTPNVPFNSLAFGFANSPSTETWMAGVTNQNIYSSTDGISWTPVSGISDLSINQTAYGLAPGTQAHWVGVGTHNISGISSIVYSSFDDTLGVNWNYATGYNYGEFGSAKGIAYGVSQDGTSNWVAIGFNLFDNNNQLLYSLDGVSFERCTGAGFGSFEGKAVAYGVSPDGTRYWSAGGTSIGVNGKRLLYSSDGIDWQEATATNVFGEIGSVNSLAYGVGTSGNKLMVGGGYADINYPLFYSSNGLEWYPGTGDTLGLAGTIESIAFRPNEGWLAAGTNYDSENSDQYLLKSLNGISWTLVDTGPVFSSTGAKAIASRNIVYTNIFAS